jgi:hypothetical protein
MSENKMRFVDLTEITVPPGFLDDETFVSLNAWPHGWEYWNGYEWRKSLSQDVKRQFSNVFRAIPAPPVQDTVNWSQVLVNYIARDENGCAYGYLEKPIRSTNSWDFLEQEVYRIDGLVPSYRRGTTDWNVSMISRFD